MYTILAVDDEADNLEMVEYALSKEFEVILVKSGEMALKYLDNGDADLLLLDIRMPGMDGFELYMKIRELERFRDTPVFFLTAANDVDTEDICFQMGAVDFISKPFEPKIILRRVKRMLELFEKSSSEKKKTTTIYQDRTLENTDENKTLAVTVNGMNIQIYQKDIYYVEVYGNTCIVRTTNRELSVRETLEHVNQGLGDRFIKVGRSYIVNTKYISELIDDIIVMQNGKRVKIPRRNKKELVQEILLKTNNFII